MAVICIQYGQCGNQIGHQFYSLLSDDLQFVGEESVKEGSKKENGNFLYWKESSRRWFRHVPRGRKFVARAVLVDTEPKEENGRRETRKRKPAVDVYSPDIQQPVQSSAHFHDWTHQEKTALLDALKTYGHYDIENLCKAVPTKSKNHIKMAIDMWWKAARIAMNASSSGEKRNKDKLKLVPKRGRGRPSVPRSSGITGRAPIDQWLHKLEESQPLVGHLQSKLLAKVFLYISKYEEHPPPEKCGGVDYRALYEYLYCMLNGYPCKMLSKESASFVLNSLNDMAVAMRERGTKEEAFFLDRLHRIPGQVRRCYGKEGPSKTSFASPSEELISKLVKIQGFNPLEVPVDLLKSK